MHCKSKIKRMIKINARQTKHKAGEVAEKTKHKTKTTRTQVTYVYATNVAVTHFKCTRMGAAAVAS